MVTLLLLTTVLLAVVVSLLPKRFTDASSRVVAIQLLLEGAV